MEQRPDPEKLLQRLQEEERQKQRGKLKIYLGAAPGVGKTYTMLQDALVKHAQGLDVIVGIVETHGRREVEDLLQELVILPRQVVQYHGQQLLEFDLDGALKRNPALILVDEMAHTNAPGLRHAKRWQDIKEMLDRGIDVYTTLNVQHIESVSDVAAQIIHSRVTETVPDSVLELADTIELVDLPPEELLKRLQEGKVYIPQQAELATEHFFRKGNLIALRELALRITAERVGAQVLTYRQGQGIRYVWPTKEKLLVCVGSRPDSIKLIRAARRMANHLRAEWIAVHVDSPGLRLTEEQRNNAIQNLRLAEQLGAETRILTGFDIVKAIMNFAREQNITVILIWKRIQARWKDFLFRGLADEVVRQSGEIDVHIITGEIDRTKLPKRVVAKRDISWKIYGISFGIVATTTLIDFFLSPYLHASNLIMVYLLGVTIVALFGLMGPSILASILSVILYEYFFAPPLFAYGVMDIQYFFTFIVMLLVAQVISHLTIITRRQAEAARLAEQRMAILHTLSRQLASHRGVDKLLEVAVGYLSEYFKSDVIALLPENNRLKMKTGNRTEKTLTAKEYSVAQWVYDLGQVAGLGTDTLSFSEALYLPLLASQGAIGVLRIHPIESKHLFSPEQIHLLEACAHQIALALEVDRLHEETRASKLQTETDHVRSTLLHSVSHDLRTPLVAVMGAASTLTEMSRELDTRAIKKLGNEIYFEAEQLSRLINNLLQLTYLEAEAVKLQKEICSLSDIINLVVNISSKKLGKKLLKIRLPSYLPLIPLDNTLIQEVLFNLIDNAIKFTPVETPIEISVQIIKDRVLVKVEDGGPGIFPDEVNKLFEKFYRGRKLTTERGAGLGLAICRSIVSAHGGEIWAENRLEGGAAFCFTLPLYPTE